METVGAFFGVSRLWDYADPASGAFEGSESVFPSATLRGGWQVGGSFTRSFFSYRAADYVGLSALSGCRRTTG